MIINTHGYVYVERFHRLGGSGDAYIQAQCDQAKADGAPMTATYKGTGPGQDDTWRTLVDVTSLDTLRALAPLPEGMRVVRLTGAQVVGYIRALVIDADRALEMDAAGYDADDPDLIREWARAKQPYEGVTLTGAEPVDIPTEGR